MYQVNKGTVKYKGAYHPKGSFFDADDGPELKQLLTKGIISTSEAEEPEIPPSPLKEGDFLPTPDEFEKMNLKEQKALLAALELKAASNADERLKQYIDYYNQDEDDEL